MYSKWEEDKKTEILNAAGRQLVFIFKLSRFGACAYLDNRVSMKKGTVQTIMKKITKSYL